MAVKSDIHYRWEDDCVVVKNTPDFFPKTISPNSDLTFYKRLTNENVGLSADEDQNVFSLVHLLASHNPYEYNANLKLVKNGSQISQTRGTFKILNEYFNQMKELGIYKDATIIVMADHGQWSTAQNREKINNPPMASLFIKKAGEGTNLINDNSTPLQVNDDAQLYHCNYVPSIIEILCENDNSTQNQNYLSTVKANHKSYFDVINSDGQQQREWHYVRWTNMNSTYYKGKFIINGNANNKSNWSKA